MEEEAITWYLAALAQIRQQEQAIIEREIVEMRVLACSTQATAALSREAIRQSQDLIEESRRLLGDTTRSMPL